MFPLIIGAVAAFCAGAVQGCTGFGFAMILTPALLLTYPPKVAVPIVACIAIVQASYMLTIYWRHVRPRLVAPLIAGGLVGVPIGIEALMRIDGGILKMAVGLFMVALSFAFHFDLRRPVKNETAALPVVGLLSGFLGGSTSLTGPPVVIFLTNQGLPRDVFRASLAAHFVVLGIVTVGLFAWRDMLTREVLTPALWFVPITLGATFFGARYADRISESGFRKVATLCAGLMGAVLVIQNQPFFG